MSIASRKRGVKRPTTATHRGAVGCTVCTKDYIRTERGWRRRTPKIVKHVYGQPWRDAA